MALFYQWGETCSLWVSHGETNACAATMFVTIWTSLPL